ncbi:TPA: hypothetical protein N2N45_003884 [Klebsiella aerogenes]|nr:hypothetical protein [Klebsiella aerogenes]
MNRRDFNRLCAKFAMLGLTGSAEVIGRSYAKESNVTTNIDVSRPVSPLKEGESKKRITFLSLMVLLLRIL